MKHLCCSKLLWIFGLFFIQLHAGKLPSVALYYGSEIRDEFINSYDWVVVDPDQLDSIWARRYGKKLFAYVSVGEYEKWRHKKELPSSWKLGENSAWNSDIMDISDKNYQSFLLNYMQKLKQHGYKNFFLDTLDSVFATKLDKTQREKQKSALAEFLKKLRETFPNSKFIANRGVEAMDALCENVDAFAIESLYKGINVNEKVYIDVPPSDREWIKLQLENAKKCGLTPISIEYLPEKEEKQRVSLAKKISDEGYVPYVTDMYLKHFGEATEKRIKREVLLLYDSSLLKDSDKVYSSAHLMASMPLEYMGYIPILKDISKGFPYAGVDRYSGVIIWPARYADNQERYFEWIKGLILEGQKVLFINDFGMELTKKRAKALSLSYKKSKGTKQTLFSKVIKKDKSVGIEIPAIVDDIPYSIRANDAKVFIKAQNSSGDNFDAAAVTTWGGYAIAQSCERDIDNEPMWSIDPFIFFKEALKLPDIPTPDPTTQNGRRVMFAHIDGDGFIEKTRFDTKLYASDVMFKDVLKRYKIPHSISIIEGEIAKTGLYPKLSLKMEKIAKKIFNLPFVEVASHSYSHPFKWQKLSEGKDKLHGEGAYHLPIKGYHFNLTRELRGSVSYINKYLAPKGKKCKLFFWTGDCLPREDALAMAELDGLGNINGGDTTITDEYPYLGRAAPYGLLRGNFWQIYCGMQNENIYTNDWLGPFWGYKNVIETFNLTENPRRIKPINIYYHFYSASKIASLDALHKVYQWTQKKKLLPLFTSEYIKIVKDFYNTSILKDKDGFVVKNLGYLRTLRVPKTMGFPDIKNSKGVVGFSDKNDIRYIHLDGSGLCKLSLQKNSPNFPYLIESNGVLKSFKKDENKIIYKLSSHQNIEATFYIPKNWKIKVKQKITKKRKGSKLILKSNKLKNITIEITHG